MTYNHCIYRPLNQKGGDTIPVLGELLTWEMRQTIWPVEEISLGSYKAGGHQVPGHLLCDSWANLLIKKVVIY